MSTFNQDNVERFIVATRLDETADAELPAIQKWVDEEPEYAAWYIAWLRSAVNEDWVDRD